MSEKVKFLILGAGPAGLSFANRIMQMGETSFLVLEKEAEAGGLCRSKIVDGSAIDIGGGHFLDVRRPKVNEFLFEFMPLKEWKLFERDSRIQIKDNLIGHPIESNIWQMKLEDQVEYLKSIATAGCNCGEAEPTGFTDWIYWKLGERIAEEYMIPYNQKMFDKELEQLGTYWLEKLPNVSFEETLLSCLTRKAYGTQPGHAWFYYPREYGYGELWLRMARKLEHQIQYRKEIKTINVEEKSVVTSEGESFFADKIILTIPWMSVEKWEEMPVNLIEDIGRLKYSATEIRYFSESLNTNAQWIYYPDPELFYHRILVRHNFCSNSRGYWTETNKQRVGMVQDEAKKNFHYMNEYAYPLNTIGKPQIMRRLLEFAEKKSIYGLGRWGEHEHYNSDLTVERALSLAEKLRN